MNQPASSDRNTPTLAILAGGAGSRMRRAKALLEVKGKPILQYLLERFDWKGPTLLVTAPGREHPPGWENFDAEAVDPVADQGPLRGVLTGLEAAKTDLVVFTTVDMPGLETEQISMLVRQMNATTNRLGVMFLRRLESGEQIEPFPCAIHRHLIPAIRARLVRGERSVWRLSQEASVAIIDAPPTWDASIWTNLNSPEDWERFTAKP